MSERAASKRGGWRLRREADGGFIRKGTSYRFVPGKLMRHIERDQSKAVILCAEYGHVLPEVKEEFCRASAESEA